MQDRPDARALVEAVARFLTEELHPELTDARLRYRTLVAANVLRVVGRELASGDTPLREELGRLATLLDQGRAAQPVDSAGLHSALHKANRALCARIRAGDADEGPWAAAAWNHAEETVIEKLRIANPRFLEHLNAE